MDDGEEMTSSQSNSSLNKSLDTGKVTNNKAPTTILVVDNGGKNKLDACRMDSTDSAASTNSLDSLNQSSRFRVAKVGDESRLSSLSSGETSYEAETPPHDDHNNGSIQNNTNTVYDTRNVRSFRYYTREALPRVAHYRNILSLHGHMSRPTLDELHAGGQATLTGEPNSQKVDTTKKVDNVKGGTLKLGWIEGVLVRCLLNIWGVMLFLRLSWVVGQAGIIYGCLVILLASAVTTLTTLSMSAICTNGEVKGGGAYYLISRSLGPEFGGAIGAIFSLANAVAVAMYVVGFAETIQELLYDEGYFLYISKINIIRIVGLSATTILLMITIIGMEWESKTQMILLVILVTAMADFMIGSVLPATDTQIAQGFIGYDIQLVKANLWADFRGQDFISVFAIFFPAATGILAGANISGDLADPSKSLPKGTLLAIIITTCSYLLFALISGATVLRDANGVEGLYSNSTETYDVEIIKNCTLAPGEECKFGLHNSFQVMKMVSAFDPIIYGGIFAATLSSALASLVSAPKIFQALCKDKLFPYIEWFAKGYGKSGEPRRAYFLTYFIAIACIAIGELNAIAPIISNFFLAAYCLINFSCFHATCTNSPGFRPGFKYYNKWISLTGAILCLIVMFTMKWWTALFTFFLIMFIYSYVCYRKPDVNWGSSTQAETYNKALKAIIKMNQVEEHVKTFRPQVLILSGPPCNRAPLLDFAHGITKRISLLVCGHIELSKFSTATKNRYIMEANTFFKKRKMDAFYEVKTEATFSEGAKALMELCGIGKLRPNFLLMGYKNNWQKCPPEEVSEYFKTIHYAFDMHLAVGIFRLQDGFDYTEYADGITEYLTETRLKSKNDQNGVTINMPAKENHLTLSRKPSSAQLSAGGSSYGMSPPTTPVLLRSKMIADSNLSLSVEFKANQPEISEKEDCSEKTDVPKEVIFNINRFTRKQKKGKIDVWWLYDDGGLTMLIPYILSTRSQWSSCKLRVFTLANRKDELDREKRNMASLLSKFRIDFSDVTVVPDIVKPPQEKSVKEFEALIEKFRRSDESKDEDEMCIQDADLLSMKQKTRRHIRLRELLLEHSSDASLIVMTLTIPRKGTCSAPLFMAWMETLTKGMPPFLLVRGNQTSVLTFYS